MALAALAYLQGTMLVLSLVPRILIVLALCNHPASASSSERRTIYASIRYISFHLTILVKDYFLHSLLAA